MAKEEEPSFSNATTLYVNYRDWHEKRVVVTDQGERQLCASTGRGHLSSQLDFTDATHQSIGFSKCSSLTSKISVKMTVPNLDVFELHNSAGVLGGSPRYTSPAFAGQLMVWKNKALSSDIVYTLIDQQEVAVAHFRSNRKTKVAILTLSEHVNGPRQLNEVMVAIVTLLCRKLRTIRDSNAAVLGA